MKTGLVLDNLNTPAGDSFLKLQAMKAGVVGILWTAGTKHKRVVYDRCEQLLVKPLYLLRVGGHPQAPEEWLADARAALAEVPNNALVGDRVVLIAANEPNIEWGSAESYGQFYAGLDPRNSSVPIAFACPSMGVAGWARYLETALAQGPNPPCIALNTYDYLLQYVPQVIETAHGVPCHITELNSLRTGRVAWLRDAFGQLERAGVKAATIFIAGGRSNGAWPDGYIVSMDECGQLQWTPQETVTSLQEQFPAQFAGWEAAGGIENNFRKHLLGIKALPATMANLVFLANEMKADVDQLQNVIATLS